MAYTEIVITRFGDHLVSMLLKDGHPVEFQCVSEMNKVDIGNIYIGVVKMLSRISMGLLLSSIKTK